MIKQVFSVYDSVTKLFLEPFFAQTIEESIRKFRTTVNHPDAGAIQQYPEDYTLFHLGEYDLETGAMRPLATPHSLGVAVQFLEEKDKSQLALFPEQDDAPRTQLTKEAN